MYACQRQLVTDMIFLYETLPVWLKTLIFWLRPDGGDSSPQYTTNQKMPVFKLLIFYMVKVQRNDGLKLNSAP